MYVQTCGGYVKRGVVYRGTVGRRTDIETSQVSKCLTNDVKTDI